MTFEYKGPVIAGPFLFGEIYDQKTELCLNCGLTNFRMITLDATGTVDFLKEGNRKHYFIRVEVKDWETWPFPSDAFLIHRGKSRNKKFKQGDKVSFQAVEVKGDLRAWKILKLWPDDE